MEYNNETLAELILSADPAAKTWIYNKHCGYCGKFIYRDETECKKCHTSVLKAISRPLPFLSSATALEKLIVWVRQRDRDLTGRISTIIQAWLQSNRTPESYRLEILIACVNALSTLS